MTAEDLRFTADEAASFLNQAMALGLSPAAAGALNARTEGWIAGLRPGITTVTAGAPARAEVEVELPQRLWLELLLGVKDVGEALLEDGLEARGDLGRFVLFHRRFATGGVTGAGAPIARCSPLVLRR